METVYNQFDKIILDITNLILNNTIHEDELIKILINLVNTITIEDLILPSCTNLFNLIEKYYKHNRIIMIIIDNIKAKLIYYYNIGTIPSEIKLTQ